MGLALDFISLSYVYVDEQTISKTDSFRVIPNGLTLVYNI